MRAKVLIVAGILLLLYLRKKNKQKEEKKTEEILKENELSKADAIDIIRYKMEEYLSYEFANFMEHERIQEVVMAITSDLENYQIPEIPEIVDYKDEETYE